MPEVGVTGDGLVTRGGVDGIEKTGAEYVGGFVFFGGVELRAAAGGKKFRFLRRIPMDPMTHSTDWGMRSMQDDPTSSTFGGQNVFDVFTRSQDKALDGTKYSDW